MGTRSGTASVIDVNTGRFVGKRDQEETILRNNLEAAKEVAYQMKLRGIGGIIIVDFIDMEKEDHRTQVYTSLLEALKKEGEEVLIFSTYRR